MREIAGLSVAVATMAWPFMLLAAWMHEWLTLVAIASFYGAIDLVLIALVLRGRRWLVDRREEEADWKRDGE